MSDAAPPRPVVTIMTEAQIADDQTVAETLLRLARDSVGPEGFRPAEAARHLAPADWRRMMPVVHRVAAKLQRDGLISATQHGRAVDALAARGPIRLKRPLH